MDWQYDIHPMAGKIKMSAPKSEKQKVEEFLKEFDPPVEGPCENTDKLLWRNDSQPHAPSIHVTKTGSIGINVGGHVIVMRVEKWHALGRLRCAMVDVLEAI